MKKIQYILTLAILSILAFGCKEGNDNWVIVEDVQPGVYVSGDATIYSGEAPASQLKSLDGALDPKETPVPNEIVYIDTWLKGGANFQVTIATDADNVVKYGQGEELSSSEVVKVYALAKDASFHVAEDGFYRVVVNTALKQAHVIHLEWNVIGAATAGGWDGETAFGKTTFDQTTYTVVHQGKTLLSVGDFKFRYGGNWGYEVALDESSKIKFHTNLGLSEAGSLDHKGSFMDGKFGGENVTAQYAGEYEVTITYNLRSRVYQVSAKLLGEPTPPPAVTLPESLFMIGSVNEWTWDKAFEMTPVHGNGENGISRYWRVQYFKTDDQIKFNYLRAWDGHEFGYATVSEESKDYAGVVDSEGNIKIEKAGWYLVLGTIKVSADGTALENTIELLAPNIYLVGNISNGVWSTPNDGLFTIPKTADGEFISPAFTADGDLRIALAIEGVDWWKAEFIVRDGKIEYRGTGGDQEPRVNVTAGQKAYLKFSDNTGSIK
ncbi:SusF/SusE family outer membrane protein [Porphyromonadaceae bacterium W3.11]|nr:SusF/SusE family outer membrane protein [Porphyromonadaceae bacterium W3.11]